MQTKGQRITRKSCKVCRRKDEKKKNAEDRQRPGSNRMGRKQRDQLGTAGASNSEIQRRLKFPSVKVFQAPGLLVHLTCT